jgi:hypothetical protein
LKYGSQKEAARWVATPEHICSRVGGRGRHWAATHGPRTQRRLARSASLPDPDATENIDVRRPSRCTPLRHRDAWAVDEELGCFAAGPAGAPASCRADRPAARRPYLCSAGASAHWPSMVWSQPSRSCHGPTFSRPSRYPAALPRATIFAFCFQDSSFWNSRVKAKLRSTALSAAS